MSIKPSVLALVVTALFTAAAWSVGTIDPDAGRAIEADSQKDKPELRREAVRGRAPGSGRYGNEDAVQELRFGYDLIDESRMH